MKEQHKLKLVIDYQAGKVQAQKAAHGQVAFLLPVRESFSLNNDRAAR